MHHFCFYARKGIHATQATETAAEDWRVYGAVAPAPKLPGEGGEETAVGGGGAAVRH